MATPKLLAFAGSLRKASFNQMLVKVAAAGVEEAGAVAQVIRLKDFPMPVYDQDWFDENGFPESVLQFKAILKAHRSGDAPPPKSSQRSHSRRRDRRHSR